MKSKNKIGIHSIVIIGVLGLFFFSCQKNRPTNKGTKGAAQPYIAVVSKGEQHDFWQQVKLGAEDAAEELNVDMSFEGPPSESDIQIQVEMLNNALAKKPVAIALAALDTNSVMDQLQEAVDKNIPIIGFDSGVPDAPSGAIYANASTDNYSAAGLAAGKMFALLEEQITEARVSQPVAIVVLNQDATGESILSRGKGFRDKMIELIISKTGLTLADISVTGNPAFIDSQSGEQEASILIEMLVPSSSDVTDASALASTVLNRVEEDNILGIFMSNEATVKGLLAATNDGVDLESKYRNLIAIGFDAGEGQKNAVRNSFFVGSVSQDPYSIGYEALELAYKAYKGEPIVDIDTGAKFYDKDNMDDPDIAGLLYD